MSRTELLAQAAVYHELYLYIYQTAFDEPHKTSSAGRSPSREDSRHRKNGALESPSSSSSSYLHILFLLLGSFVSLCTIGQRAVSPTRACVTAAYKLRAAG
eukprot:scaffold48808_cov57-Phaeocystis_antarctica.AAC.2